MPAQEIAGAADAYEVCLVVLLFERGISGKIAGQEMKELRCRLPENVPVVVSGRAVNLLAKPIPGVYTAADFGLDRRHHARPPGAGRRLGRVARHLAAAEPAGVSSPGCPCPTNFPLRMRCPGAFRASSGTRVGLVAAALLAWLIWRGYQSPDFLLDLGALQAVLIRDLASHPATAQASSRKSASWRRCRLVGLPAKRVSTAAAALRRRASSLRCATLAAVSR